MGKGKGKDKFEATQAEIRICEEWYRIFSITDAWFRCVDTELRRHIWSRDDKCKPCLGTTDDNEVTTFDRTEHAFTVSNANDMTTRNHLSVFTISACDFNLMTRRATEYCNADAVQEGKAAINQILKKQEYIALASYADDTKRAVLLLKPSLTDIVLNGVHTIPDATVKARMECRVKYYTAIQQALQEAGTAQNQSGASERNSSAQTLTKSSKNVVATLAQFHYDHDFTNKESLPLLSACVAEDLAHVLAGQPVMDIPFQQRLRYYLLRGLCDPTPLKMIQSAVFAKTVTELYGQQLPDMACMRNSVVRKETKRVVLFSNAISKAFRRMMYMMRFRKGLGASGEDHQNPDHKRGTTQAPNPRQSGAPNKQTGDHRTDARSRKGGEHGLPRRGDEERRGRSTSRKYEERPDRSVSRSRDRNRRDRSASHFRDTRIRNDRDVPHDRNSTNYEEERYVRGTSHGRGKRSHHDGRWTKQAPSKRYKQNHGGERHDRDASHFRGTRDPKEPRRY